MSYYSSANGVFQNIILKYIFCIDAKNISMVPSGHMF